MTVNQLIKKLEKIRDKYGKRILVTIDKEGNENWSNPDYTHTHLNCIEVDTIRWSIDDNWELADGSERMKTVVVLNGK